MIGIPKKLQIRECLFELEVSQGMASIKFPCSFFIEWKTANGKHHIKSINRVKAVKGVIPFQQRQNLQVLMIYDLKQQSYRRKEAIILVNLLSNSRPNDPKLVGRVEFDLATVANDSTMQELKTYPLKYCSVEGSLTFKMVMREEKSTNLDVGQLQRSDLTENDSPVPDNQVNKEDMKSQKSSSSLLGKYKERTVSKTIETPLQERLSRLKSDRQQFNLGKVPYSSRLKKDQIVANNEDKDNFQVLGQPNHNTVKVKQEKKLLGDLSVPVLAKNTSEFNSPQVSEKKIRNDNSEEENVGNFKGGQDKIIQVDKNNEKKSKGRQKDIIGVNLFNADKQKQIENLQGITIQVKQAPPQIKILELKGQKNAIQQETTNKNLHSQIQILNQSLKKLKTEVKEKEELLVKKQQQISLKQQQITYLKNICEDYQGKNLKNQEQITFYQLQVKQLKEGQNNLQTAKEMSENQLTIKIQSLQEKLEQMTHLNEQLKIQVESNIKKQKQRILTSDVSIIDYEQKLQELNHRCETQQKNHENTKLQLTQLRDWYNELQGLNQKLNIQKFNTDKQVEQLKQQYKKTLEQLNENMKTLQKLTNNANQKQQEQTKFKDQTKNIKNQLQQTKIELANKIDQLQILKQQLSLQQQEISKAKSNENIFNKQLLEIQRQLQQKQLCLQSIVQDLKQQKQKTIQLQAIIADMTKNSQNIIKSKQEAVEDTKNRLNDLVNRLKQKQQLIARKQRENQQSQTKLKQSQFTVEQYREKIKGLEAEKLISIDRIKQLQKQAKGLQKQLNQSKEKLQRNSQSFNVTINRLKQSLEQQTNQKRQIQKKCDQIGLNIKNGADKTIEQLQIKVQSYRQKQQILKQNLLIVQRQLNKLAISQQQRQEQQQQYRRLILELTHNNSQLSNKNGQLQNQLLLICERNEALQAEVQLLNAYMPEDQNKQELMDINQRLNDKNKQLLSIIQGKNGEIAELERKRGEATFNEAQQEMSNSRAMRDRRDLEERIVAQAEQNENLQRQFERLSNKYEEQLNTSQKINQQKINQLILTINGLNLKIKDYEQNKGLNQQESNSQKLITKENQQKLEKLEETLREKDFQLQFFTAQIKQLNQVIEGLNSQLGVLNSQYQNIYSELGEKQYQLYETSSKIKDLEDASLNNKQQIHQKQAIQSVIDQCKTKLKLYQTQIKAFKQKQITKDKDSKQLQEKIVQLQLLLGKQDQFCQSLTRTVENFQAQQIENKKLVSERQQKIQQFKSIISRKDQQYKMLAEEISTLKIDLLTVKNESEFSKEQPQKQQNKIDVVKQDTSKKSTPINKFKNFTSPSPNLNKGVNLIEVVQQINTVIQKRKKEQEVQTVLRLVIDNNARQEEEFQRWSQERGVIQEKAKMASKQIQKAKSTIMKGASRSIADKTQITALLRPIETVISQLVNLSQTLSQIDIEMEQQQQQQQPKEQITV